MQIPDDMTLPAGFVLIVVMKCSLCIVSESLLDTVVSGSFRDSSSLAGGGTFDELKQWLPYELYRTSVLNTPLHS